MSITARLLGTVNSAFFGLSNRVEAPYQAINILGIEEVKNLVLAAGVFNQFNELPQSGISIEEIYHQSLIVSKGSKLLATALGLDSTQIESAYLAGLLHDIGRLVLLSQFQDEYLSATKLAENNSIPWYQAMEKTIGVNHAAIGAYILSQWGFPDQIVEAVAFHLQPSQIRHPTIDILTCVHTAVFLNNEDVINCKDEIVSSVDTQYLNELGLMEQLAELHGLCLAAV
jgi:putative nucleotidyltransferase with HDIG domain